MARLIKQHGSTGAINDDERRVIDALLSGLTDHYTIMPHIEIAATGGRRWECDVIVVAPHAVYALEVEDCHGEIVAS